MIKEATAVATRMDPKRYLHNLFKISAVIGKNDVLYKDIARLVVDNFRDEVEIIILAIEERVHVSIIEFLVRNISRGFMWSDWKVPEHIFGKELKIRGKMEHYINILYHSSKKTRAYYGAVAAILRCKIVKPYIARQEYINTILKNHSYKPDKPYCPPRIMRLYNQLP